MLSIFSLSNLKTVGIVIMICCAVWFYKDYQYQKEENIRQTANADGLRKADSLRFSSQTLTTREIQDYLDYGNKDLAAKLLADKIKTSRIESIISQSLKYQDQTLRETDISKIAEAVRQNIPAAMPFKDSTKCLVVSGFVSYENDSLKLKITDRAFNNNSNVVAYWERRQWKFLGIKTRLLGKRQWTAKNYSDCGEVSTVKIERKK